MARVRANGADAIASYAPDPERGPDAVTAHSVQLFLVERGRVRRTVAFVDPAFFAWFGLPLRARVSMEGALLADPATGPAPSR